VKVAKRKMVSGGVIGFHRVPPENGFSFSIPFKGENVYIKIKINTKKELGFYSCSSFFWRILSE
jgi:hypothetical protein